MTVLFISLFFIYFFLMTMLIIGWNSAIQRSLRKDTPPEIFISVIIAARNEESTIGNLLEDIGRQHYKNVEVIVVDDHSEDNTARVIDDLINQKGRSNLILLQHRGVGKKECLAQGIQHAKGTIIVTTDADCRVGAEWLSTILGYFQDETVKMVFGGVNVEKGFSLFSKLQALEFVSLVGSGAATWALGFPTMCNGANLAFRKSTFEEVGGYAGNQHIPSGDDEFLMRKIAQRYLDGITFMNDPRTIVVTSPLKNLKDLLHQRIRWAGKWRHHPGYFSRLLAILVFFFQLSVLVLPFFSLVGWINPILAASLWGGKVVFEFFFLRKVTAFLKGSWNTVVFILLQLIYPFYVVLIGLVSNIQSFEWKGRWLKSINKT